MIKIISSKLFWFSCAFLPSLFVPIYTEYKNDVLVSSKALLSRNADPMSNYLHILGHVLFCFSVALFITEVIKKLNNKSLKFDDAY